MLKRELLARIPHASLSVLPDVGHLVPLEAPGDLAALILSFCRSLAFEAPVS